MWKLTKLLNLLVALSLLYSSLLLHLRKFLSKLNVLSLLLCIILSLSLPLSTLAAFVALQKGKEKSKLADWVISETCVGSASHSNSHRSHLAVTVYNQSQFTVTVRLYSHSLQSQSQSQFTGSGREGQ